VPPPGPFIGVSTGENFSCGLSPDGRVECWGMDDPINCWLSLPGSYVDVIRPPLDVVFREIFSGIRHSCGLTPDGEIVCWGWDEYGQLAAPEGRFVDMDLGYAHGCAIGEDGRVSCWGCGTGEHDGYDHDFGQCDPPEASFVDIAVGGPNSCGVRTDGRVQCWGCLPYTWMETCTPP